ncbi:UDP-N-acetylmuramoyl-L-alanine--D-glutamate ligase [Candidatus Saccharibacteria bacterium]|nr:UDP-N-acetylmuramoyl-L-alanine--D-glutamate ligase [Candidatus Saccharibacteria bacterium]
MNIAIAGYGVEGESNYKYFSRDPSNTITIVDDKVPTLPVPLDVKTNFYEGAMQELAGFDLVVRTAGLNPNKIETDGKVWSATNEFFEKCPAQIIGITGTKGKGTTASLITNILEVSGKKVWLVGNIGRAALDVLDDVRAEDIVVYELSSFQLWDIEKSPHIAVVLFIEGEHLDVHKDINEYILAKANITKFQTSQDIVVYNKHNDYAKDISVTSLSSTKVPYQDEHYAHVKDGNFWYGEQIICSTSSLKILGKHNHDNACAAIDVVWQYGVRPAEIEKGLAFFSGLPHRLKFVREVHGVKYYDDSIATTPSAAIAALRAFSSPKVIILGGSSKGADFTDLAYELKEHSVAAILMGDEAGNMAKVFNHVGFRDYEIIDDPKMEVVVERAHNLARKGDVVLLSPATASFGLFKNYSDRGDQFIDAVNSLN